MPEYVLQKTFEALNQSGKSVKNSKILLLGLAYKKNVDDHRESVTFKIMDLLSNNGATVDYNDPYIPGKLIPVLDETKLYDDQLTRSPISSPMGSLNSGVHFR